MRHWISPIMVVVFLAAMMWVNWQSAEERATFEAGVLKQHQRFHEAQLSTNAILIEYINKKAADRFTGKDGNDLEEKLSANITALRKEFYEHQHAQ